MEQGKMKRWLSPWVLANIVFFLTPAAGRADYPSSQPSPADTSSGGGPSVFWSAPVKPTGPYRFGNAQIQAGVFATHSPSPSPSASPSPSPSASSTWYACNCYGFANYTPPMCVLYPTTQVCYSGVEGIGNLWSCHPCQTTCSVSTSIPPLASCN